MSHEKFEELAERYSSLLVITKALLSRVGGRVEFHMEEFDQHQDELIKLDVDAPSQVAVLHFSPETKKAPD